MGLGRGQKEQEDTSTSSEVACVRRLGSRRRGMSLGICTVPDSLS